METSTNRPHHPLKARRLRNERGLALLMTILVLSSLLILGISLSTAVKADFEEAVFYRSYNEAHIRAQEGMANAMGFLMYDVWGVNEEDTFVCSQWAANPTGDKAPHKQLGSTFIADAGGIQHAFEYNAAPLLASELELSRVEYPGVPLNRFDMLESTTLVADWDWVNTNIGGGTRVNQHELYGTPTAGRSRYTDAFLPTSSDVNDWFEVGLHINRSDLHGYWRNNFPNRPVDIYAGGDANGWGFNRSLGKVSEYRWRVGWGDYHGLEGYNYPFAEGKALNDPVITAPWNFVNTNQMIGDSFSRVFRSDLVDTNYENSTYDAMLLGPKITAAGGVAYGGAINLNEVNNNYEIEQFPGVVTPNDTTRFPAGSADYSATNIIDSGGSTDGAEDYYYSGRSYHYNEAKWIYTYDEMGKPTGRYAVTILADGGLPNVNSLGNPRANAGWGWYPMTGEYPGLFPPYDRGYTIMGNMLTGRLSYGRTTSTAPGGGFSPGNLDTAWYGGSGFRAWSDETGANWIKNGSLNSIRQPGVANNTYAAGSNPTSYYRTWGQMHSSAFRNTGGSAGDYDNGLYYTDFPLGTASINHPNYLKYMAAGELYAGPNNDIGHLKDFGMGITSHVFFHMWYYGPVRTRAEFMMVLKKRAFMIDDENDNGMNVNGLDENPRGNGTWFDTEDLEIAERDCQFLAGWVTPIGYSYTFDSLWNFDRVVVDDTGDLWMCGSPDKKSNLFFWSGLASNTRNAGDPQSGYEGPCPDAPLDNDQASPGPAAALAAGDYTNSWKNMYYKVKGKSGAKALLQELAQLRFLGDGLGVKSGGYTPYSPLAQRSDSAGVIVPAFVAGPMSRLRANAAGALTLAYLLSTIRVPNWDLSDQWRTEMRFGETAGVLVNWQAAAGGWDPDITLWPNMHWRQAWEVASKSNWDYVNSVRSNSEPTYGAFALHQYMRSTPTEVGRARVYQPYHLNDVMGPASLDGFNTGNTDSGTRDFRTPIQNNQQERYYQPKYEDIPYNQWMTHHPSYFSDMSGIGLRETWSNYTFDICANPTTQVISATDSRSCIGISVAQHANTTDFRAVIRTTAPLPVKAGDEVFISGTGQAAINGNHVVVNVLAPNAFEFYITAADATAGALALGDYDGTGGKVNLRMVDDPNLATVAGTTTYSDYGYPGGLPLVMNYIELCFTAGRSNDTSSMDNVEYGESLATFTLRKNNVPSQYFRGWVTDYDVANKQGWTNLYDGSPQSTQTVKNFYSNFFSYTRSSIVNWASPGSGDFNQSRADDVRFHAGFGNSQPFLYVKGRLMQGNPAAPGDTTQWFVDPDGKAGLALMINMFDQFDPIHWGVSVREADAGGNLAWVNYNIDEQHQRGVQRVFGRLVDMTWGIGEDRIPSKSGDAAFSSIDQSYRWSTRSGNRGLFIRGHTPIYNQRGHSYGSPQVKFPFPFESYLIDMPMTLAIRQLAEKFGSHNTGGPDSRTAGEYNMGTYVNSFSWGTHNRTIGQDCDWPAMHWWAMDGLGINSTPNAFSVGAAVGPAIAYDGTAPILRWDSKWDRSIDGHHDAFLNAGNDTSYWLFSPSTENASHQFATQGHPEQFKVIYFHPYFFPQQMIYGTRTRFQLYANNSRFYDYLYPSMTTDSGTVRNSPNVITAISRSGVVGTDGKRLVSVTYSGNVNAFVWNNTGSGYGTSVSGPAAGEQRYVRIVGCGASSFNGIYKIESVGGGTVTYYQDGSLPAESTQFAISGSSNQPKNNLPGGFCYPNWAFARDYGGAQYMGAIGVGTAPWVITYGASPLPASAAVWTRGNNMTSTTSGSGPFFPVDNQNLVNGSNANAQQPLDFFERVHGTVCLPDYLGIDGGDPNQLNQTKPADKLWKDGPWWVDGDEGQGPIELTNPGAPVLQKGDFILNRSTGARATVVTLTGGKAGNKLILQPCAPYAGGFRQGDILQREIYSNTATPFLSMVPGDEFTCNFGGVGGAFAPGQRMWFDYGRYCSATRVDSAGVPMSNWATMNASVDPTTSGNPLVPPYTFAIPPASTQNVYLRNVLEFSLSTPWVLDNNGSGLWQYNSAYCFKASGKGSLIMDASIFGGGASARIDPAFGNVRWYLAKGTSHEAQVFSFPTPMERNSNHIAWGASPYQRDRWANGIEADPNRPGTGPNNPGFNRHNGTAPGAPLNQYIKNKLELAIYQIGNCTFSWEKNMFYLTPMGAAQADDEDFHLMNWWDLNFCTDLDSMWEMGVVNSIETGNAPNFSQLGTDPVSLPDSTNPSVDYPWGTHWAFMDPVKQFDIAQNYINSTSYTDIQDNNDIGIREILKIKPTRPVDIAIGRVDGHYNIDQKTTWKMNPNLITSPILYQWLKADWTVGQDQPTFVFGSKPARGYISVSHVIGYCGTAYSSYHMTNWNSRVWYKHQCIAPSAFNDVFGVNYVERGYGRMSNMLSFNPAPVYTAMITGQAINDAGESVAQIRLTVGVERTFDGKCNILEYQINAGMSGVK